MTTTREAALEAALRNIAGGNLGDMPWQANYDRIRAVANAAISTPATEPHGYVEGLVWENSLNGRWIGVPPVKLGDLAFWVFQSENGYYRFVTGQGRVSYPTLEAAQSAAQDDYSARIISCLAARPAPQPAADTRVVVKPLQQWGVRELARASGVSHATVSRVMRGLPCDSTTLKALSNAVGYCLCCAAPTALQMVVKPLVWENLGDSYRAPGLLFGYIRIENYGNGFEVLWSAPGICDTLVAGNFATLELAQAAAQEHYTAAILSAIIGNATPAPSDKIAEAARVLLDDLSAALGTDGGEYCRASARRWSVASDAAEAAPTAMYRPTPIQMIRAALRALAGQGETP